MNKDEIKLFMDGEGKENTLKGVGVGNINNLIERALNVKSELLEDILQAEFRMIRQGFYNTDNK